MKRKGRGSNYHNERIASMASELAHIFSAKSWDKISVSSKFVFLQQLVAWSSGFKID
jgi:hypothetical protein